MFTNRKKKLLMNEKAKEFEKKKGSLSSLDNARLKKIKEVVKRANWSESDLEVRRKREEERSKTKPPFLILD